MAKLGLQLYTLRDLARQDFLGTIRHVAEIGYEGIEFAGYFGTPARVLKDTLDRHGLLCAGTVVPVPVLEQGLEGAIEYARIIASPAVICPWLTEAYRADAAAYRRTAESLNRFGALCRANGLQFLYHIHGYEWQYLAGEHGMEILLQRCDPAAVAFQADVYWIEHAGVDSVAFLQQHGARCPYIHLKDMADKATGRGTEVGAGAIDMRGVMRQAKRWQADWLTVEQEEFSIPPFESVAVSLHNLRQLAGEA